MEIHPFSAENWMICMILINVLLLKLVGICITFGASEDGNIRNTDLLRHMWVGRRSWRKYMPAEEGRRAIGI